MISEKRKTPFQKKALGQIFLQEQGPGIKTAGILKNWGVSRVLEIGPGNGILTFELVDAGFNVFAVEKDERFSKRIEETFKLKYEQEPKRLNVVTEDILRFDVSGWIKSSDEPCSIVGNIPYRISSQILLKIIPCLSKISGAVFMFQLEFAQRLAAVQGTKAFGSISVFTQLRATPKIEEVVDKSLFFPPPKVDSALVSLTPKELKYTESQLQKIEQLTRTGFSQRRKMLHNSIKYFINEHEKKYGKEQRCPIDLNRRPDSLSPEEFVLLAKHFFPEVFA